MDEKTPETTLIGSVGRIDESADKYFDNEQDIRVYVEAPLVPAVNQLLQKGIRTISTGANTADRNDDAYILIDYGSLSETNRQIAKLILNVDVLVPGAWGDICFKIPITKDTPIEEVTAWGDALAERFVTQPATWERRYSLDQARSYDESLLELDPTEIAKELEFFYAPDGYFYISEAAYKRYVG